MAEVAVTLKLMPESADIDLDKLDLSGDSEATGLLSFEGSPF